MKQKILVHVTTTFVNITLKTGFCGEVHHDAMSQPLHSAFRVITVYFFFHKRHPWQHIFPAWWLHKANLLIRVIPSSVLALIPAVKNDIGYSSPLKLTCKGVDVQVKMAHSSSLNEFIIIRVHLTFSSQLSCRVFGMSCFYNILMSYPIFPKSVSIRS